MSLIKIVGRCLGLPEEGDKLNRRSQARSEIVSALYDIIEWIEKLSVVSDTCSTRCVRACVCAWHGDDILKAQRYDSALKSFQTNHRKSLKKKKIQTY